MGDPREKKTPDYPQAELGLLHMWPELGSNLMSTHSIGFYGEIWKIVPKLSSIPTVTVEQMRVIDDKG